MRGKSKPLAIRKYLVSVYITQGYAAVKPLAIKYGYPPRYINRMAAAMLGHSRVIYYSRHPFVEFEAFRFDPRFATPIRISNANTNSSNHSADQAAVARTANPPPAGIGSP